MDADDVETIAVLGAGNMGHGIAEVAALAGFEVRLRDISEELVEKGYDQIEWSLNKLVEREELEQSAADDALDRVTPVVDLGEAAGDADLVIEAVPEKMEIKKEVYAELERNAPEHTIFATNTSSLSVTELSEATERPEQFCGMHFFNPPVRMDLVEVIAGAHTDAAVLDTVEALATRMGKTPVRVQKDSPGFIVNRVLVPLMNEAAWLVDEEVATVEEIDSSAKYDMGLPMGPFELADQVGIDVGEDVLAYMHETLGDAYEPAPLLVEKVEAGDLGKKTGSGFYDYESGGAEVPADAGRETVVDVLTAIMANEVAKLVGGDVADPDAIDRAVTLGGRFPEGPAKMADEAGLASLLDTLRERHDATGAARYEPAAALVDLVENDETFHDESADEAADDAGFETLRIDRLDDGVANLVIDRAHRMNAISGDVLDELVAAIDHLEADDETRAILLTGDGDRAFSAGADVQSMATSLDPLSAVELSRQGQKAFGRLEACDLPVVAGVDGYCLGGGMELATACDLRIASRRSEFGQPEHDLGLLPGWGGTQRLSNIVGEGRAREIIFTTERYDAETMGDYGFVNEVVDNEAFTDRAREYAADLAAGPPIAQAYTKRAMLAGRDDTDAGLEVESQAFGHLIGTDDVMEGISAFVSDRDPEFTGE